MPNGGEHHERLGVCPLCGSPRIRIRQQRHQNLLWRCSGCNGVFRTPKVAEYIIPPGNDGSGYVFAESIPQMERRGRLRGRPSRRRHGTGWGCAIIIAVAVIAVIAAYSALERNAEFPGADIIRTFVEGTPEAYQEAQSSDIDSTDSGSHDTQDERQQYPDPAQRHHELKELMVQLTNEHRATAGVPSVRLGFNTAAQLHAEAALQGCYSSHWDQWGLKPNHRYTLTGGTGADAENGSGLDYCIKPSQNYTPIEGMEREVIEAVQGWMASPGHRRNLLDPAHTILNVGIAHDQFNVILVQHFSSDYVNYTTKPGIDPGGVLLLEGEVSGATLAGSGEHIQPVRVHHPAMLDRPAPDSPGEAHDAWASANPPAKLLNRLLRRKGGLLPTVWISQRCVHHQGRPEHRLERAWSRYLHDPSLGETGPHAGINAFVGASILLANRTPQGSTVSQCKVHRHCRQIGVDGGLGLVRAR